MANQVVTRGVNIYINSGEAQKALDVLLAKQKKLTDELANTSNPARVKKLQDALDRLKEPIDRAAKKVSGELNPSLKDTEKAVAAVRREIKDFSGSEEDLAKLASSFKQGTRELDAQRQKVGLLGGAMKSFFQEAKTVAVGVIVGNTIQAALQTVLGYVTGIVTGSAKISDQLADIQRVTGLTTNEVKELNAALAKIDTRTSTSELRDMAIVAGKLGVAKDDILGFVQATDKLKVALGDELGDVDSITTGLGKILNVFEGKITGENITHLGNAIVDLANKGVASGTFIVDFTQRLGGIAKASNLSLGAVVGLAAGLEESGQQVESSSTAISKLLSTIATDLPKAAKIAGAQSQEEINKFADLFAKKPQEALLQYAAGLQKNKKSFAEIASAFKDAGEEGARVISTLATMGTNTEFFKRKIDDATEALKGNTEIEEAFRLKNENLGGSLDRLKKSFASLFTSSSFQGGASAAVSLLNAFIDVIKASMKFISDHGILVTVLGGIYLATGIKLKGLTLATALQNAIVKVSTAFNAGLAAGYVVLSTVVNLVTGRIKLAAAAQIIWNTVTALGAGGFGVFLVALGAVVVGIEKLVGGVVSLTQRQRENLAAAQNHADVLKSVQSQTQATKDEIAKLTKVITSSTASTDEKAAALEKLKNISADYLSGLTLENITTQEGIDIINKYIKKIDELADAKAKANLKAKLKEQLLESQNTLAGLGVEKDNTPKLSGTTKFFFGADGKLFGQGGRNEFDVNEDIKKEEENNKKIKDRIAALDADTNSQIEAYRKKIADGQKKIEEIKKDTSRFLANTAGNSHELEDLKREVAKNQEALFILTGIDSAPAAGGRNTESVTGKLAKLREELKKLQDLREAAVDDKSIASFNAQIKQTQDEITRLEGGVVKLSKSENKAASDMKQLAEELKKISTSLLPDDTLQQKFDKQLQELDDKYDKLKEKAHGNNKLLLEVDRLYLLERNNLFKDQGKAFRDALDKESDAVKKAAAERAANLALLNPVTARLGNSAVKLSGLIDRDSTAKAELDVIKSSGKARLDAELRQLHEQEEQELAGKELTENEKLLIEEKYRQKRKELEINYYLELGKQIIDWAGQIANVFTTFSDIRTQKENAELEADKARNDKKKKNLDDRLKKGIISQQQYDREVQKIDKEQEKREKEVRLKQFKRDQRAQITQALMNGAMAVVSTLAARPGSLDILSLGTFRAINIALAVATTAAQVAKIASQKPPEFGRGGYMNGPSHNDATRGMPVINPYTKQVHAYVEGGEGIINKRSMRDSGVYTVTGTPSQIGSAINQLHGGVHWQSGAVLKPRWSTQRPQQMNYSAVHSSINTARRFYAAGGVLDGQPAKPAPTSGTDVNAAMVLAINDMVSTMQAMNKTIADLQEFGVEASVRLGSLEDAQKRKQAIIDDATMKG